MLIGSFVMPAYRLEPVRQPVFGDVVGNRAGRILCAPDVDRLAAHDGGEHRSDGNRTGVRGLPGTMQSVVKVNFARTAIRQLCQQLFPMRGSAEHPARAQRIGLNDAQARLPIDQENSLADLG